MDYKTNRQVQVSKNPKDGRNRKLTPGDGIYLVSIFAFEIMYIVIFQHETGHFPHGGKNYNGPDFWELPLGFGLAILFGTMVRYVLEKIAGKKL